LPLPVSALWPGAGGALYGLLPGLGGAVGRLSPLR